jgi:hypothetical protein
MVYSEQHGRESIVTKTRIVIALSLFALLAACGEPGESAVVPAAQPADASNADIGDHVVHFSALSTDQLTPEVARAFNIVRSKNRAMLTVSVLRKSDQKAVTASVSVQTVNLTGQLKNISMRKAEEGDAIYYIGEAAVANRETLVFDISVTPEGADRASELRFKREFFTD